MLIKGKGNKLRRCPLWQQTVNALVSLILDRNQSEHVFLNRCKQPITRFGIHIMVKRYVKKITEQLPSMEKNGLVLIPYATLLLLIYCKLVLRLIQ